MCRHVRTLFRLSRSERIPWTLVHLHFPFLDSFLVDYTHQVKIILILWHELSLNYLQSSRQFGYGQDSIRTTDNDRFRDTQHYRTHEHTTGRTWKNRVPSQR